MRHLFNQFWPDISYITWRIFWSLLFLKWVIAIAVFLPIGMFRTRSHHLNTQHLITFSGIPQIYLVLFTRSLSRIYRSFIILFDMKFSHEAKCCQQNYVWIACTWTVALNGRGDPCKNVQTELDILSLK